MVIENSFTASSVPNLLPALSKPIKTIVHRGRMRFASQFERRMKSRYFNDCREMLDKNSILEPSDSGTSIERFRALNWEKILWLRISSVHDVIVQSTVCLSLVFQLQKLNQSYLVKVRYV